MQRGKVKVLLIFSTETDQTLFFGDDQELLSSRAGHLERQRVATLAEEQDGLQD